MDDSLVLHQECGVSITYVRKMWVRTNESLTEESDGADPMTTYATLRMRVIRK
jgi:hypothetical protein